MNNFRLWISSFIDHWLYTHHSAALHDMIPKTQTRKDLKGGVKIFFSREFKGDRQNPKICVQNQGARRYGDSARALDQGGWVVVGILAEAKSESES